jgi:hypothetical protein
MEPARPVKLEAEEARDMPPSLPQQQKTINVNHTPPRNVSTKYPSHRYHTGIVSAKYDTFLRVNEFVRVCPCV